MRIWYSVCGDGMGHAVRSRTIMQHLKDHKLLVTSSSNAYNYLKKYNPIKIECNYFTYKNNEIRLFETSIRFLMKLPLFIIDFIRTAKKIHKFKPDLIISDFESMAHYYSKIFGVRCISIDNIHIQTDAHHKYRKPFWLKPLIRFLHPKSSLRIITSFIQLRPKKGAVIVPPIIRDKIKKLKPKKGSHVLVYQTTPSNTSMLKHLKATKNKYIIYGMNKKSHSN